MTDRSSKPVKTPTNNPLQWAGMVTRALQETANTLGRTVTGIQLPRFQHIHHEPSGKAGIDVEQLRSMPSGPDRVYVSCLDYCQKQVCATDILDLDLSLIHISEPTRPY